MDAAIACFRRRGFHQATMAEICAQAGDQRGCALPLFLERPRPTSSAPSPRTNAARGDQAFSARRRGARLRPGALPHRARLLPEVRRWRRRADRRHSRRSDPRRCCRLSPCAAQIAAAVRIFTQAIEAAQARGEVDATLDPEIAANTLFGALEGIGLRRAFCRETDADEAISQFRALAERYLEPRVRHEQARRPEIFNQAEGLLKRAKDAAARRCARARDAGESAWKRATDAPTKKQAPSEDPVA
jgi:TetR/AcrR family transcriptional repressor of uid operon